MVRGRGSPVGATRTSANGYHYTKTRSGWRLTHHIIAEKEILRRPLQEGERVKFLGSKSDLSPDNLKVVQEGTSTDRAKLARIEARIEDLQSQRAVILERLRGKGTL